MFKDLYKSPSPGNGKSEEIIFATVPVDVYIFSLGYWEKSKPWSQIYEKNFMFKDSRVYNMESLVIVHFKE